MTTHLVYCLTGDGELQEGQNWEAVMFASANKVDNLIAVVDYNGKQIDGPTSKVLNLGDLKAKFEAFDWKVIEMYGNDIPDVIDGMKKAKSETGKGAIRYCYHADAHGISVWILCWIIMHGMVFRRIMKKQQLHCHNWRRPLGIINNYELRITERFCETCQCNIRNDEEMIYSFRVLRLA